MKKNFKKVRSAFGGGREGRRGLDRFAKFEVSAVASEERAQE